LATEVGLDAVRKERFRLHCARNYRRNGEEVKDTMTNIVRTLCCLARLYGQHLQMKLVKVLKFDVFVIELQVTHSKTFITHRWKDFTDQ